MLLQVPCPLSSFLTPFLSSLLSLESQCHLALQVPHLPIFTPFLVGCFCLLLIQGREDQKSLKALGRLVALAPEVVSLFHCPDFSH